MRLRTLPILLSISLVVAGCAGSGDPDRPEPEDCARLRDHVIELRLAAADTTGRLGAADLAQHRAALQAAAGASYVDDCREQRTPREVSCLLTATDLGSLRTCAPLHVSED